MKIAGSFLTGVDGAGGFGREACGAAAFSHIGPPALEENLLSSQFLNVQFSSVNYIHIVVE